MVKMELEQEQEKEGEEKEDKNVKKSEQDNIVSVPRYLALRSLGQYCAHFSRPISLSLVSITTMVELCSQSIRQKSSTVSLRGPWEVREGEDTSWQWRRRLRVPGWRCRRSCIGNHR